jgi:hypothetical protein
MRCSSRVVAALVSALVVGAIFVTSPVASADPSWPMPNLIRIDLQGAQDAIQSLTRGEVWYSGSTDRTGQGRAQLSDRNWVVCTSTPPPGSKFNASTEINFGVVRIDTESCP